MRKVLFALVVFFSVSYLGYSMPIENYQVVKDGINIRVDATVLSFSLGVLDEGDSVEVVSKKYEWYKIIIPRKINCYVAKEFFRKLSDDNGQVMVMGLNLRAQPALNSYIIGKVYRGETFKVVGEEGDWYAIQGYPRAYGWVHENFLMKKESGISVKATMVEMNIADMVERLSTAAGGQIKELQMELAQRGPSAVPELEEYLIRGKKDTVYNLIGILSQIARENPSLVGNFLEKVDSSQEIGLAAAYLDIVQDSIDIDGAKAAYFYMANEGILTTADVREAKDFLYGQYCR